MTVALLTPPPAACPGHAHSNPIALCNYYCHGRSFPRMCNSLHIDPHYKLTSGRCHAILYFIRSPPKISPPPRSTIQAQFQSNCPLPHHIMVPTIYTKRNCMLVRTFDQPQDTLLQSYGRQARTCCHHWQLENTNSKTK